MWLVCTGLATVVSSVIEASMAGRDVFFPLTSVDY